MTTTSESQISIFLAMRTAIFVYQAIETSAPNNPKMSLNTKMSKLTQTHVTTPPDSQIPLCFVIQSAISEILAICHFLLGTMVIFDRCVSYEIRIFKIQRSIFCVILRETISKNLVEKN